MGVNLFQYKTMWQSGKVALWQKQDISFEWSKCTVYKG